MRRSGADSRIADLYQQGSLKVLFPGRPAQTLEAVTLNTSGGLTGGDRISFEAEVGAGARLCLSTQAAERAYASRDCEPARVTTGLTLGEGAMLHWLPQETILFDRADLCRTLAVDMVEDATLLAVEPLVFGRHAMGETLRTGHFTDSWRVRRGGVTIYAEALRLAGDIPRLLATTGAGAMATLLYAAPDAEAHLAATRASLPAPSGTSLLRPGVLVARVLAKDAYELRRLIVPLIERLSAAPLPKVWRL
ncbi:urease accessory protein UreD [Roseisalinus antarcticus]|uniref:Urease accessory protein UreD n=1 Tax=Roseisalinus antarcticus TaxID=254357 RepID=A0A1Y5SYH7_9RHOB|nr:urease accessory protein UreD [Roseisalinus antarcticus]SLN51911.1 Urease accessory protein UreD [Roseisalinus antarcticus]